MDCLPSTRALTWETVAGMFATRCRAQNVSAATQENYRWVLRSWTAFLGERGGLSPQDVTALEIRSWLEWLRDDGLAGETLTTYYARLRTIFGFLLRDGFIERDPFAQVHKPRAERRLVRPWTVDEFRKVLGAIDARTDFGVRDRALLLMLADTGARLTEILTLTVAKADLASGTAVVMGKGRKERPVAFGSSTRTAIQLWLLRRGEVRPEEPLFCDRYGAALKRNAVQHNIKRLTVRAGVASKRLGAHALRHFFATEALKGGMDIASLQQMLGHSTPTMSLRYAVQTLGDALQKARSAAIVDKLGPLPNERRRVRLR